MPRIASKYFRAIIVAILPLLALARSTRTVAVRALAVREKLFCSGRLLRWAFLRLAKTSNGAKRTAVRWRAFPAEVQNERRADSLRRLLSRTLRPRAASSATPCEGKSN